jgi:orotidine-5'-phosphate decarboxylase
MMEAAVKGSDGRVGVLGVTVLTSMNAEDLRSAGFKDQFVADLQSLVVKRAAMAQSAGCSGVVCSGQEVQILRSTLGQDFVMVTPGIRPAWDVSSEDDQQRVVTPAQAIANGADYLVIGRPIRDARDPREAALRVISEIEAVL